jgi:hypothetical protein
MDGTGGCGSMDGFKIAAHHRHKKLKCRNADGKDRRKRLTLAGGRAAIYE